MLIPILFFALLASVLLKKGKKNFGNFRHNVLIKKKGSIGQ